MNRIIAVITSSCLVANPVLCSGFSQPTERRSALSVAGAPFEEQAIISSLLYVHQMLVRTHGIFSHRTPPIARHPMGEPLAPDDLIGIRDAAISEEAPRRLSDRELSQYRLLLIDLIHQPGEQSSNFRELLKKFYWELSNEEQNLEIYIRQRPYGHGLTALTVRENRKVRVYISGEWCNFQTATTLTVDQVRALFGLYHELTEQYALPQDYQRSLKRLAHAAAVYEEVALARALKNRIPPTILDDPTDPTLSPLTVLEMQAAAHDRAQLMTWMEATDRILRKQIVDFAGNRYLPEAAAYTSAVHRYAERLLSELPVPDLPAPSIETFHGVRVAEQNPAVQKASRVWSNQFAELMIAHPPELNVPRENRTMRDLEPGNIVIWKGKQAIVAAAPKPDTMRLRDGQLVPATRLQLQISGVELESHLVRKRAPFTDSEFPSTLAETIVIPDSEAPPLHEWNGMPLLPVARSRGVVLGRRSPQQPFEIIDYLVENWHQHDGAVWAAQGHEEILITGLTLNADQGLTVLDQKDVARFGKCQPGDRVDVLLRWASAVNRYVVLEATVYPQQTQVQPRRYRFKTIEGLDPKTGQFVLVCSFYKKAPLSARLLVKVRRGELPVSMAIFLHNKGFEHLKISGVSVGQYHAIKLFGEPLKLPPESRPSVTMAPDTADEEGSECSVNVMLAYSPLPAAEGGRYVVTSGWAFIPGQWTASKPFQMRKIWGKKPNDSSWSLLAVFSERWKNDEDLVWQELGYTERLDTNITLDGSGGCNAPGTGYVGRLGKQFAGSLATVKLKWDPDAQRKDRLGRVRRQGTFVPEWLEARSRKFPWNPPKRLVIRPSVDEENGVEPRHPPDLLPPPEASPTTPLEDGGSPPGGTVAISPPAEPSAPEPILPSNPSEMIVPEKPQEMLDFACRQDNQRASPLGLERARQALTEQAKRLTTDLQYSVIYRWEEDAPALADIRIMDHPARLHPTLIITFNPILWSRRHNLEVIPYLRAFLEFAQTYTKIIKRPLTENEDPDRMWTLESFGRQGQILALTRLPLKERQRVADWLSTMPAASQADLFFAQIAAQLDLYNPAEHTIQTTKIKQAVEEELNRLRADDPNFTKYILQVRQPPLKAADRQRALKSVLRLFSTVLATMFLLVAVCLADGPGGHRSPSILHLVLYVTVLLGAHFWPTLRPSRFFRPLARYSHSAA